MLSNLELHRARLKALGGSAEERMQREKLKSLESALKYSYQSERVYKDGIEYRALLNNNKLKPDYDDKIISIPHSAQFKVGDIFFWERASSNWIIYLRQYTEDAYFRGYARRAEHKIKWKDEFGNAIEVYAAVRGPVEDKIRSQAKSGISFDEPNYSLSLIVPSNEHTKKLKRYSRVTVAEQPWEVTAVDAISEEGVIELVLVENYLNREEDTKELVGGKLETKIKVSSCLDELLEVKIGCSKNIDNRIKQIKSSFRFNGNLDELSLWLKIPCNNYKLLEKELHMCLRCYNTTNEWFRVPETKINQRLFMLNMDRYK